MLLRRLTPDDVVTGARLTAAAFGGPPREARMRRYLELEPEGWFGVEDAGTLVALGGAVRFGDVAWLGLMVVEPGHQRAGLGRTVARAAVDWAHDQGCTTIRLIATPAGTPLYRQLGFVPDGESQELAGVPRPLPPGAARSSVHRWGARDTEEVARFDAPAFGSDRSRLLAAYAREFSGSAWVAREDSGAVSGFLVVQDEPVGPWCATDEQVAGQLLDVALAGATRPLKAGVVDDVGARLLTARGLVPVRPLARMRLGPPVRHAASPLLLTHASYAVG